MNLKLYHIETEEAFYNYIRLWLLFKWLSTMYIYCNNAQASVECTC